MKFTFDSYAKLIALLQQNNYFIANYDNWQQKEHCVILRHDIDLSIKKALMFAKLEQRLNVTSTYFVLVTSDFYNALSAQSIAMLREIQACGHEIGLHFDELSYPEIAEDRSLITAKILQEKEMLEKAMEYPITKVSMHRPSKETLAEDIQINGMINSYSNVYFKQFKYLSDSRLHWREPVLDIIKSNEFDHLHILTHAFSYAEKEQTIETHLREFVKAGNVNRFDILHENFTNLEEFLQREEFEND